VAYRPRGIKIAEAVKLADAEKHMGWNQLNNELVVI
jgi:hypothetical protein